MNKLGNRLRARRGDGEIAPAGGPDIQQIELIHDGKPFTLFNVAAGMFALLQERISGFDQAKGAVDVFDPASEALLLHEQLLALGAQGLGERLAALFLLQQADGVLHGKAIAAQHAELVHAEGILRQEVAIAVFQLMDGQKAAALVKADFGLRQADHIREGSDGVMGRYGMLVLHGTPPVC